MIEKFLIPLAAKKALIVSDSVRGLEELEGLLKTMGGEVLEKIRLASSKYRIDPRTYLRSGKLDEIVRILQSQNLDLLLLDFDLSPSQLRNIEQKTKNLVLDRTGIILEIFNRHARTKEAKLQVELARLQYLMPRLRHLWSHFERQRGSGGGALKGKGMGEKQIEVDRRLVKDQVQFLKQKIKDVEAVRELQRRHRQALLKVAIVGYTNAGKSTLLNALTQSEAKVEDALFATLDAQVKTLNPKSRPTVLAIDTVGFIDRLPHGLVASFYSTLSEVLEADLLVHVVDASHPEVRRHFDVTLSVLEELKARHIPMLLVLNKVDRLEGNKQAELNMLRVWAASLARTQSFTGAPLFISAYCSQDIAELRETILSYFERSMETYEIIVPFEDGRTVAKIFEVGKVDSKHATEKGMFFKMRTLPHFAEEMNLSRFKV